MATFSFATHPTTQKYLTMSFQSVSSREQIGLKQLTYRLFFSKLTTNDIPLHFLMVLCEYKAAPVVLDDPPPSATDVLILN